MIDSTERLIQARFDRVADATDERDWSDVLSRAGSRVATRRLSPPGRRFAVAGAAAVVALAMTGVAFGWPGRIVDFFEAPPAPESVAQFFNTFNEMVPPGMSDGTVGQPRAVMTATFDVNDFAPTNPTEHTLYVAPRTDGGFCYIWTDAGGSCADPLGAVAPPTSPGVPHTPVDTRPLGVVWYMGDYVTVVDGWVRGEVQTVEARFADGTSVTLPITWVSAPIDAGFFVYAIPAEHLTASDALASVVAIDADGNVVDRQDSGVTKAPDRDVMQTLPDGTKEFLPRRPQASRAREPFSFRTASGGHAYLWVMPRTGGGSCYVFGTGAGGGSGCTSTSKLTQLAAINDDRVGSVYFAQVKPGVAAIELRYAKGTSEQVTPVDGFVLHELPAARHLRAVIALSSGGTALFTEHLPRSAIPRP